MTNNISIIAAVAENNVIGKNNQLIWHLSADMKFFKNKTTGHHIIMGRKTFESLGKRALPNRTTIVITRQTDYDANDCLKAKSIEEAIDLAKSDTEIFICGGSEIYKSALPYANTMYITQVHAKFDGDAYFPEIDKNTWKIMTCEKHQSDEKNEFDYSFVEYKRIF